MRVGNIFISPLDTPDNTFVDADIRAPPAPHSLQWLIKSCHLLMVINYWYLADCMKCLCQGVKCLRLLSPHLPIGCFLLPFKFKSQLWGEAVSCWDLMRTWEKEQRKDQKVYGLWFSLKNRPAHIFFFFFFTSSLPTYWQQTRIKVILSHCTKSSRKVLFLIFVARVKVK